MIRYFYLLIMISLISAISGCVKEDHVFGGNYNLGAGNYSQSIFEYNKAIELNPNNAESYHFRGVAYERQGNFSQAISDYTKSIELDSNNAQVYLNRSHAYSEQGDLPKVIADCIKALEIDPNVKGVGNVMSSFMKDDAAAFLDFQQKAKIWQARADKPPLPEEVRRFRVLADGALQSKNFGKAAGYYEQGLAIEPMWSAGHYNAALIYGELKIYSMAVIHMKRFLELKPDDKEARASRDQMYVWEEKDKESNLE